MKWEDAIYEAWKYHDRVYHSEKDMSVLHAEYDALPQIVKDALTYLCECGEIG